MAEQAPPQNFNTVDPNQVRIASGLDVLIGIWLFISAFILAPSLGMSWDNACVGIFVAILALIRLGKPVKTEVLSWINAVCGLWVLISAWVFFATYAAAWNAVATGLAIIVLGIWAAMGSETSPPPAQGA